MNSDFWDHCHCTATGNQKVAQALAEAIMGQPFLNRPVKAVMGEHQDIPPDASKPRRCVRIFRYTFRQR